jgi:plastocyanin
VLAPGAAFDRRFPTPGTFAFLCLLHPEMQGTVTVQAGGNAAPDPTPAQPARTPRPTPTTPTPTAPPSVAPGQPAAPAPVTVDVAMVDLAFEPPTIEAVAGSTIRWTNEGAAPHTATAENGSFDSGIVPSGGTFEVTLDSPGTFAYVCQLHPGMAGSIVVAAGAGTAAGAGGSGPAVTAPARASFDLTRLGIVILLVGGAMALFGKIVRSVVRPG